MSTRRVSIIWLLTILGLTFLAGFSWVDLRLSPAAGGQLLEVTGFLAFPIVSALLLLQGSALLAAFFTPPLVGRIIAAVQVPIVVWHGVVVLTTIQSSLQDAVAAEITKATGVVGVTSQAQLLEDALDNNIWYVYLAVLVLNLFALVARSLVARPGPKTSSASPIQEDSEDLWETQR
jgi:hypothetical protein